MNELGNSEDFDLVLEKAKIKISEFFKEKQRLENELNFLVKQKKKLEEKYKSKNWLSRIALIDLKLKVWTSSEREINYLLLIFIAIILGIITRNIILGVFLVCIVVLIFEIIHDKRNPEVLNNFILKEIERVNIKINYIQKRIEGISVEINNNSAYSSLKDNEVIRGGRMKEKKYVVKIGNGYFVEHDELDVIITLDVHPIFPASAKKFDNRNQAEEVAEQIGGEVEELFFSME